MSQQSSKEETLKKNLTVLVHNLGLSPEEIASLRLSNLHLAGKAPHLTLPASEEHPAKKVDLDLETHRAMVGWLVTRPDSVSDALFVDENSEPLNQEAIRALAGEPKVGAPPFEPDSPPAPPEAATPDQDETLFSVPGPRPPTRPAAVKPPPSAPEMSSPPPGLPPPPESRPFSPPPPMRGPEAGPPASPFPPRPAKPAAPSPPPQTEPEESAEPAPSPVPPPPEGMLGPRKPPKPVRKETDATPVIMRQEPEPTTLSESTREPGPESGDNLAEATIVAASATAMVATAQAETPLGSEDKSAAEQEKTTEPLQKESPQPAEPKQDATKPPQPEPVYFKNQAPRPEPSKPKSVPGKPVPKKDERSGMLPVALGGGSLIIALIICLACAGATGWLFWQGDSGSLLAGLLPEADTATPVVEPGPTATPVESDFEPPVSPINSPLTTPTLPPTFTPTALPATATPVPQPTDTPQPTNTPEPTNTPVPTDTPTPEPTDEAPPPADTPTPEPEPTSGFKYGAPKLVAPDDGTLYNGINEIALTWEPVGELAADEQYAVRIVYRYNSEVTYGGANVKDSQWVVPLQLYQKVDPPENRYEWFVVVERLNEDGSGTAVSPESERMSFVWR